jgi:hypothetical protein
MVRRSLWPPQAFAATLAAVLVLASRSSRSQEAPRGLIVLRGDSNFQETMRLANGRYDCVLFRSPGYEDPAAGIANWNAFAISLRGLIARVSQSVGEMPGDFDVGVSPVCHAINDWVVMDAHSWRTLRCLVVPESNTVTCSGHPAPHDYLERTRVRSRLSARHLRQLAESINPTSGLDRVPLCADCRDLQYEILTSNGAGEAVDQLAGLTNLAPRAVVHLMVDGLTRSPSDPPSVEMSVAPDSILADACTCASTTIPQGMACTSVVAVATTQNMTEWVVRCQPRGSSTPLALLDVALGSSGAPIVLPAACRGARVSAQTNLPFTVTAIGAGQGGLIGPSWMLVGDPGQIGSGPIFDTSNVADRRACQSTNNGTGITVFDTLRLETSPEVRADAPQAASACVRGGYPVSSVLVRTETDYSWQCLARTTRSRQTCGVFKLRVLSSAWTPVGLAALTPNELCQPDPTVGRDEPVRFFNCPSSSRNGIEGRFRIELPFRSCE